MHRGIDFIRPFLSSLNNQFIMITVDYISKWVKAIALITNDFKVVVNFLKKGIFKRFGAPKVIISDGKKYFFN